MIEIFVMRFGVEEAGGGIAALGIDPKAFIIQLITWLFVFVVLIRFVFKPIIRILQQRQDTIDEGIRLTTEMVSQKDKLDAEVEKTLKNARKEADHMLSKTHDQASAMIKSAEEAAQAKVDGMIADAHARIEDETIKARRKLEQEVINLVVEATEIVASEKLDPNKDAGLITEALKGRT